jgi:hypothetical protein
MRSTTNSAVGDQLEPGPTLATDDWRNGSRLHNSGVREAAVPNEAAYSSGASSIRQFKSQMPLYELAAERL